MAQAKGSFGQLAAQYEQVYGTNPSTPDMTLLPFESEAFRASRNMISSNVITSGRHPSQPVSGNTDATGSIETELGSTLGMLFYATCGSIKTEANSGTGEAVGSALTTPAAVIDAINQTMTVTVTSHGLVVGDTVLIAGLTAPTSLNDTYCRVQAVTSADIFVLRIPIRTTTTYTLGSGSIKKVTTAATTYKHTMAVGGKLPSLLIEKGFTDIAQYFRYGGAVVASMSVSASSEGFQKTTFQFAAQDETSAQTAFDTTPTNLGKVSFSGFQASIEEGGSPIANVRKVDLTIDNQLDTSNYVIGDAGVRGSISEGVVKVSGTLECLFENLTLYTKAAAATESSLKLIYTYGTGAGTAGNEYLEIYVPELIYAKDAPVITGAGGVLVTLPFEAYYNNGAPGTACQMLLKNTQLHI